MEYKKSGLVCQGNLGHSLSGNGCISFAKPADLSGPKKRRCPPLAFSQEPCLGVDDHTENFNLYGLNSPSLVTKKNIIQQDNPLLAAARIIHRPIHLSDNYFYYLSV